jgi:hypothetical protein
MKINSIIYIFSLNIVLLVSACQKQEKTITYKGICMVNYEKQEMDTVSGQINITKWDTTYTDQILVIKDTKNDVISFTLTYQNHLCPNFKNNYEFKLSSTNYKFLIDNEGYDNFTLVDDSLRRSMYRITGSQTNYTKQIIELYAKKQ